MYNTNWWYNLVTYNKMTEWEITKMEVGNEIKIFITLTKHNTCPVAWRS